MPSMAYIALDWLDRHPAANASQRRELLAEIPVTQFADYWGELHLYCEHRRAEPVERRPGNALNIEIGAPQPRCMQRSPDGRGLLWLMSGGSVLAYGVCGLAHCPRIEEEPSQ